MDLSNLPDALPDKDPFNVWNFILTDKNYVPIGEILQATNRRVAIPLSKLDTLSFQIRLDNDLWQQIVPCDGYIKAYRNKRLMFFGPVISAEISAGDNEEPSISVNAISSGWFLAKRLVGKSATGHLFADATDRAQIVKQLIDTVNGEDVGDGSSSNTGVYGNPDASSSSAINFTAGPYKSIMEVISELGPSYDGFEWRIEPIDNFDYRTQTVTTQTIGVWQAAPRPFGFGSFRENVVFEYGHNMRSFKRTVTRDSQANKVYHTISGAPDAERAGNTVSALNIESIRDYRLVEELIQVDLYEEALRRSFTEETVRVRAFPRQLIEFTPYAGFSEHISIYTFGTDYEVGDVVRARAEYDGVIVFDANFRIWGVTFEIDNNGIETGAMALAEETS